MVACISASWMNMPICLHTGKQLAFVFFVYCKNKIPANLLENLNKMFFYFIFPFLTRKKKHCTLSCTFHYVSHKSSAAAAAGRDRSVGSFEGALRL